MPEQQPKTSRLRDALKPSWMILALVIPIALFVANRVWLDTPVHEALVQSLRLTAVLVIALPYLQLRSQDKRTGMSEAQSLLQRNGGAPGVVALAYQISGFGWFLAALTVLAQIFLFGIAAENHYRQGWLVAGALCVVYSTIAWLPAGLCFKYAAKYKRIADAAARGERDERDE